MSQFESIHIQGFRRLVDVKLELRPLMVMIGANGVGKTSFLDFWKLLSRASSGDLLHTISEMGGFNDLISRSRKGAEPISSIHFQLVVQHADRKIELNAALATAGIGYWIASEFMIETRLLANGEMKSRDLYRRERDNLTWWQLGEAREEKIALNHELALWQFTTESETRAFQQMLLPCGYYQPVDVSRRSAIRLPQMLQPARRPAESGDDLVSTLHSLRESDPDRFEVVEDTLRAAFPDFERLQFQPVGGGMMALAWWDRQFTQPIYMPQLSEGTLRFLWLTALLLSRDLPAVTLIDETEVSLHPELLSLLVSLMREASQRTQLIVATHSDRLIQFLEPKEVLVADVEDGAAKFAWGDELDIEHWLENYTLDQLWQMGRLGGRAS